MRPWRLCLVLAVLDAGALGALAWRMARLKPDLASGVLLLAAIGSTLALLGEAAAAARHAGSDTRAKLRLLIAATTLALVGMELSLRALGRYTTYLEKNGQGYESLFDHKTSTWFLVHPPNYRYVIRRPEFLHERPTNSLGLVEHEIPTARERDEDRVIALGDSFTEGFGTDYENTWVKVAERRLAAARPGRRVTTINAGITGSDPPFELTLLREKLLAYGPDLVVVATNASDVSDFITHGGRERFRPDGTLAPSPRAPRWERLYSISYVFRHVVHDVLGYDWQLVPRKDAPALERGFVEEATGVFAELAALGARNGFRVLIVVHPVQWEAAHERWSRGMDKLVARLQGRRDLVVLDLLAYLRARGRLGEAGAAELFWPLDGHYTPKGYELMGRAVADTVLDLRLLPPAGPPSER
jgi:lysophospholipase L1-like esterase